MIQRLRLYYVQNGIGAVNFRCLHSAACSGESVRFTSAKESFVGLDYERGTLPRLLFLSLDSGSAETDPRKKTLQAIRGLEMAERIDALPRHKHWYLTHELAWVLLRQFKPTLTIGQTSSFIAHANSAKCCQNNAARRQAEDVLFNNCRGFIPGEIRLLEPDIIVTQGMQARRVIEQGFVILEHQAVNAGTGHSVAIVRCGSRRALWIPTYHPSNYGKFWPQKRECWSGYAVAVGQFAAANGLPR